MLRPMLAGSRLKGRGRFDIGRLCWREAVKEKRAIVLDGGMK